MKQTGSDITGIVAKATPAIRRRDAETLAALMQQISGRPPMAWGSIIGFGLAHYVYPTGTEGDTGVLGFAPRRNASTIYFLDGLDAHAAALERLGPHTTGVSCLYIKDLEEVDLGVLEGMLRQSLAWAESGGYDELQMTVLQ